MSVDCNVFIPPLISLMFGNTMKLAYADRWMLNTAITIIYVAAMVVGKPHPGTNECVGVNKFGL